VLLILLACAPTPTPAPTGGPAPAAAPAPAVRKVDVAELHGAMAARKVPLVDVRTPAEFAAGHVPGAVNVPLDQLSEATVAPVVGDGGEVWVICEVGGRSAAASQQLSKWGLHPVDVGGGTRAWRSAGYPVE
jgi:rhodanese-related sulfurtransferase